MLEHRPDESLITSATDAYIETLIWQSTLLQQVVIDGEVFTEGSPLEQLNFDAADVADETWNAVFAQLADFLTRAHRLLGRPVQASEVGRVGHEFCLSRNRHGAGFFDSQWLDAGGVDRSRELQTLAVGYGPHSLDVEPDGALYSIEGP